MRLPKDLEQRIQQTIHKIEEGKKVPYVTSWERMAKEEGLHEGLLSSVVLLMSHRFGELSNSIQSKLRKLPEEQLRELVVALLDFETKSDLHNWLKQHAPVNGSSRKQTSARAK